MTNSDNKKVLFLGLSGIGNLIMQLPAIEAVKKARPAWHITVWVAPRGTKDIALSQPYIDEVVEMPIAGSAIEHIKRILQLRKKSYDIGIVLSPGQLVKSAAYMFLVGIPMRIGNTYPFKNNSRSNLFLTHGIDEIENMHDIEQNIRLLEPLGLGNTQAPYYELQIPNKNKEEAEGILATYNFEPTTSYIGIHAGCAVGFEWKRWPLERFAEVAKTLAQKNSNIRILLFGGKDESADKQAMLAMINKDREIAYDIAAPLLTTAAIMKKCSFFLSNDSGLMHIAAATGVPVLGLFGPTSEILTGPRGEHSSYLRAPGTVAVYDTEKNNSFGNTSHENLLKISTQMVLEKIQNIGI